MQKGGRLARVVSRGPSRGGWLRGERSLKPRMRVGELTQGSIGALSWREAEGREAERRGLRWIKGLPCRDQPFPGIHASDNMLLCDSDECRLQKKLRDFA